MKVISVFKNKKIALAAVAAVAALIIGGVAGAGFMRNCGRSAHGRRDLYERTYRHL